LPRAWIGVALGIAVTIACVALAGVLSWRRSAALPAWMLFLAPLVPLVGAALLGRALPSGERLVYLASAGAAWLLAIGFERLRVRAPQVAWAGVTLLAGWSMVESVRLQPDWRDDDAVFAAMVRSQPENPVGWILSAQTAASQGDRAEAERRLARAAAVAPRNPTLHLVRAHLHYRDGEWEQVVAETDTTLALSSWIADARVMRADALVRLRRLDEAGRDTRTLLAKFPDNPRVLAIERQRQLLARDSTGAGAR